MLLVSPHDLPHSERDYGGIGTLSAHGQTLACFAVLSTIFLTLAGLLMALGQH